MAQTVKVRQRTVETAETPAPAAQAKPGVAYAMDARGRRIGVKKLSALEKFRIARLLPAGIGDDYKGMAITAASVCEIDGTLEPLPRSEVLLEARIAQLDDEGLEAAGEALQTLYDGLGQTAEEIAAQRVVEDAEAKN